MARRRSNEAPLHVSVLQVFERRIEQRRQQHLETMAKGLQPREYDQVVGRAAECKALIEQVEEMLTAIRKDELEFDDDHDE